MKLLINSIIVWNLLWKCLCSPEAMKPVPYRVDMGGNVGGLRPIRLWPNMDFSIELIEQNKNQANILPIKAKVYSFSNTEAERVKKSPINQSEKKQDNASELKFSPTTSGNEKQIQNVKPHSVNGVQTNNNTQVRLAIKKKDTLSGTAANILSEAIEQFGAVHNPLLIPTALLFGAPRVTQEQKVKHVMKSNSRKVSNTVNYPQNKTTIKSEPLVQNIMQKEKSFPRSFQKPILHMIPDEEFNSDLSNDQEKIKSKFDSGFKPSELVSIVMPNKNSINNLIPDLTSFVKLEDGYKVGKPDNVTPEIEEVTELSTKPLSSTVVFNDDQNIYSSTNKMQLEKLSENYNKRNQMSTTQISTQQETTTIQSNLPNPVASSIKELNKKNYFVIKNSDDNNSQSEEEFSEKDNYPKIPKKEQNLGDLNTLKLTKEDVSINSFESSSPPSKDIYQFSFVDVKEFPTFPQSLEQNWPSKWSWNDFDKETKQSKFANEYSHGKLTSSPIIIVTTPKSSGSFFESKPNASDTWKLQFPNYNYKSSFSEEPSIENLSTEPSFSFQSAPSQHLFRKNPFGQGFGHLGVDYNNIFGRQNSLTNLEMQNYFKGSSFSSTQIPDTITTKRPLTITPTFNEFEEGSLGQIFLDLSKHGEISTSESSLEELKPVYFSKENMPMSYETDQMSDSVLSNIKNENQKNQNSIEDYAVINLSAETPVSTSSSLSTLKISMLPKTTTTVMPLLSKMNVKQASASSVIHQKKSTTEHPVHQLMAKTGTRSKIKINYPTKRKVQNNLPVKEIVPIIELKDASEETDSIEITSPPTLPLKNAIVSKPEIKNNKKHKSPEKVSLTLLDLIRPTHKTPENKEMDFSDPYFVQNHPEFGLKLSSKQTTPSTSLVQAKFYSIRNKNSRKAVDTKRKVNLLKPVNVLQYHLPTSTKPYVLSPKKVEDSKGRDERKIVVITQKIPVKEI